MIFNMMIFPFGKPTLPNINVGLIAEWNLYKIAQQTGLRS